MRRVVGRVRHYCSHLARMGHNKALSRWVTWWSGVGPKIFGQITNLFLDVKHTSLYERSITI